MRALGAMACVSLSLAAPVAVARAQVPRDTARADTARADTTRRPPVLAPVVVTSTRGEQRIEDEPVRVEVLAGEDVGEKTEMRPADIRMLLSEMAGVRVQTTSPSLGASVIRVQGLPGRHTLLLSDGLPLYGTYSGGFSLVQLPPIDLRQVEVIKGAASALYGPQALGGVVNLVSRRPNDTTQALLNVTSQGGTDALAFVAHPAGTRGGFTLLAGGHRQQRWDVDDDGWSDVPGFTRVEARPRWFTAGSRGTLMLTAGAFGEARRGGGRASPAPDPAYFETLDSRHGDVGAVGRVLLGAGRSLALRASGAVDARRRGFGDAREPERTTAAFGEAALTQLTRAGVTVLGAALQHDDFHSDEVPRFDLANGTAALFAQQTVEPLPWLAATVNGRCDATSQFGTICTPRASLLLRGGGEGGSATLRASAGAGWFAPTSRVDETEGVPLREVSLPQPLAPERARTASLDLGLSRGAVQVNATLFDNRVATPLRLADYRPVDGGLALVNAPGAYTARGVELFAVYQGEPLLATVYWTATQARERDVLTGATVDATLVPRHTAAVDLGFEGEETGTYVALEAFYTGRQALEMDPYRERSPAYVVFGIMARQRIPRGWAFLNLENLGDTRQTRWSPLLPPAGVDAGGGRRTVAAWAPLEGRVINGGVRVTF